MAVETPYVLAISPEAQLPPQETKRLLSNLRYYNTAVDAAAKTLEGRPRG